MLHINKKKPINFIFFFFFIFAITLRIYIYRSNVYVKILGLDHKILNVCRNRQTLYFTLVWYFFIIIYIFQCMCHIWIQTQRENKTITTVNFNVQIMLIFFIEYMYVCFTHLMIYPQNAHLYILFYMVFIITSSYILYSFLFIFIIYDTNPIILFIRETLSILMFF